MPQGSDSYNLKLGEARAEAVRRYLNKQGVALNRMSTISYGKAEPVESNKTKKAARRTAAWWSSSLPSSL